MGQAARHQRAVERLERTSAITKLSAISTAPRRWLESIARIDAETRRNDLWVRLPQGNATDFLQVAVRHGVMAAAGPLFSADGGHIDRIRLPFVLPPEQLREGVQRLCQAWEAYLPGSSQPAQEIKTIV